MDKDRTYYYKTSHACDYSYEDYLEFCSDNDITGEDIAKNDSPRFYEWCNEQVDWDNEVDMLQDAIISMAMDMLNDNNDDYEYSYNDVKWMKCYLSSQAMGWRNLQAESKVMDVVDIYEVLLSFEDIEVYYDDKYGYGIIGRDHDGSNSFDLVIIHEDFIDQLIDGMYPMEKLGLLKIEDFENIDNIKKIISFYHDKGTSFYDVLEEL